MVACAALLALGSPVIATAALVAADSATAARFGQARQPSASSPPIRTSPDTLESVPSPQSSPHRTPLERTTGLSVSIDSAKPAALTPGKDLRIRGVVANTGDKPWKDAQVYLDIAENPATSRSTLAEFNALDEGFGTRIVDFGLFDQIGRLPPDSETPYKLDIPYAQLPISGSPGVYHVGVTVIATDRQDVRSPVARTDILMPQLPGPSHAPLVPTGVVTLVPLAATIKQTSDGVFLDDNLASSIAFGGQLHNLLDFVAAAPPNSVDVVLDPALRQAVADMAQGYQVRSMSEIASSEPGHPGHGVEVAQQWLSELDDTLKRQDLLFMPWAAPDTSALGSSRLSGVVAAAVRASQRYAADQRITTAVASWPFAGASTRRGLAVSALSEAPLRIVSQRSLVKLRGQPDGRYPPSQILVPTAIGQVTAIVTRTDVAGQVITPDITGTELLQDILAEATVRSLDGDPPATSVIAVPFGWDPGVVTDRSELARAYDFPTVAPTTAAAAVQEAAVPYAGPILMPRIVSGLSASVLDSVKLLRNKGQTLTDLVSDQGQAVAQFDETIAAAGTTLWRNDSVTRTIVNERAALRASRKAAQVTVTGPTFVALSSASGRFPLTVTNGLAVPVTVNVVVRAENPAVKVDPIEPLDLEAGQHRDIEAVARTAGSGLTSVRVRLTTTSNRPVGQPWQFDIRSTQIGLAIWIVMGIGAAVLFAAAGRQIYLRIKEGRMQPREEPSR